jgi:hypothetical protein
MSMPNNQTSTTVDMILLWMMPIAIFVIIGIDIWLTAAMLATGQNR